MTTPLALLLVVMKSLRKSFAMTQITLKSGWANYDHIIGGRQAGNCNSSICGSCDIQMNAEQIITDHQI